MGTELLSEFEARVAKHAALADPARLRIVDLLAVGDYAPTELRDELNIPGNLLSHHLQTLETAGIVARRKSEADKRRSYVRLVPGSLDHLGTTVAQEVPRVVFVCTRNSARSQLAAALWSATSDIPASSAGTHPADSVAEGALAVAARHGLSLGKPVPQHFSNVIKTGDFIVTVCDNAHEEITGVSRIHWSIPDPLRSNTPSAFESAFQDISERVSTFAHQLQKSA